MRHTHGAEILTDQGNENPLETAERDIIALGIAVAAIILLVGTGGSVLPQAMAAIISTGSKPDVLLVNALLLNIALIIFGWRRYRELTREISERRSAEERAHLLAATDPLTQCLNRRSMVEATEDLRTRSQARGEAIAYCMIDLDNFKQINDMHGHTTGDAVLVMLCDRVRALLPHEARLARLGGDEFAFVMPYPMGQTDRVDDLVIRLFERMAHPFQLPEVTIELTISIGIATDKEAGGTGAGWRDRRNDRCCRSDAPCGHGDVSRQKAGPEPLFLVRSGDGKRTAVPQSSWKPGSAAASGAGEFVPFYEQQIDLDSRANWSGSKCWRAGIRPSWA